MSRAHELVQVAEAMAELEFERFGMTAESYAQRFSVPVRVRMTGADGH